MKTWVESGKAREKKRVTFDSLDGDQSVLHQSLHHSQHLKIAIEAILMLVVGDPLRGGLVRPVPLGVIGGLAGPGRRVDLGNLLEGEFRCMLGFQSTANFKSCQPDSQ